MTLSIFDLEWTAWKGSKDRNWSLNYEQKEIVEFGCICFDSFNSKKILKKNFHFKTINDISPYFTNLTKITKNYNNTYGKKFSTNFLEIVRLMNKSQIILCNGLDKEVLIENFEIRKMAIPLFVKRIKNISHILSKCIATKNEHIVSSELLDALKIKSSIKNKHRAADDAHAIYLSMKHLIKINKIKISDLSR